ncbi:class I SAM-dependent methyltransferase [Natronorubrum tibetense]|uniref:class I SAM-dependent methyltransferase n=1 Tax=Natronorubrum tibetense TaxID=63128 RepID=UPI0009D99315|nr:class I SAM-dependent methyltransferase [Natronorubrum tibetense]
MSAKRLDDLEIDTDTISTEFTHLDHMYSGRFSKYYYRRFDQALEAAQSAKDETVLEIGGGTGVFLLSLSEIYSDVHFTDISREHPPFSTARRLLNLAGTTDDNVKYAVADATTLPYQSNTFDSVFVLDVLEHIPDERNAISEIARVTAKGGRAIVSAPIEVGLPIMVREGYRLIDGNRRHTESLRELLSAAVGRPSLETNDQHRGYDYRQTMKWLKEDFEKVSVEYCPWPALGSQFNPTAIITAEF